MFNNSCGLIKLKIAFLFALTGFDYPAIDVFGMTLRLAQVVFAFLFIFRFNEIQYPLLCVQALLIVCAGMVPSLLFSENILKSTAYIGWLLFNFFIVVGVIGFYIKKYRHYVADAIIISFRLQVIFGFVLMIVGIHERIQFLYYEPSYLAIAMVLYFSVVLNRGLETSWRKWATDAVIIVLAVVGMQSATLLFGLLTVSALVVYKISWRKAVVFVIGGILLLIGALYFYSQMSDDLLATTIRIFIDAENFPMLIDGVVGRGGNRVPRIMAAFDIFREHPLFGVGLGAYEQYIKSIDLSSYHEGLPWLDISDKPAVNIYIELLATVGLFGAVPFLIFICIVYYSSRTKVGWAINNDYRIYSIAFVSMLFMLNFESNYLRLYLWGAFALLIYYDSDEYRLMGYLYDKN